MELELQREEINRYQLELNTTLCQEETQEAIVPDASPDILRILDTRGQIFLTGKQIKTGSVSVTGLICANVFYLPEHDSGSIHHLNIELPFTCQAEVPELGASGVVHAFPRIRWAEARVLNPRKILLRVDLAMDLSAYRPLGMEICTCAQDTQSIGIEQCIVEEETTVTGTVQEKQFNLSERLELGNGIDPDAKILGIYGDPVCQECKLVGNKLIFKGNLNLETMLCHQGTLKTVTQSLPFSQIMEVSQGDGSCTCDVRIVLAEMQLQRGENMLEAALLAQATVREKRKLSMLKDLYSTGWNTELVTHPYSLYQTVEDSVKTVPVREFVETTTMVRGVCHCWAALGDLSATRDGGRTLLTAETRLNILYQDDAEQLQTVYQVLTVQCVLDGTGDLCRFWCGMPREMFVSPVSGGLEVRFAMDYHCLCQRERQVMAVLAASTLDERARHQEGQPSVILRMAEPGEQLWDIAKAYGTTVDEITRANELEESEIPHGKMLLIPSIR